MFRKNFILGFPYQIQLFADDGGGDGGAGGGGDGGGAGDYVAPSQAEYEKMQRDLHFFKSEHGNLKKSVGDLQATIDDLNSKGLSELDKVKGNLAKTEEDRNNLAISNLKNIAKYEGKIAGLSEGDIAEILIVAEDTAETIAEKVKNKKEGLEQRFTQWAKEKGYKSSLLDNGGKGGGAGGDDGKTHAEKWNEKKQDTKKFYDV